MTPIAVIIPVALLALLARGRSSSATRASQASTPAQLRAAAARATDPAKASQLAAQADALEALNDAHNVVTA